MAQWSRADRTLYTKVVYYGPALGGKTTCLEYLHRLTDPQRTNRMIAVQSGDDRTYLFDLLRIELGEILGQRVVMELYSVPGQVRYDTTRQVVLNGADAVIFVADSSVGREEQNRWSLQNLRMNMRARQLDPANAPVMFQFNKQDLPDAAPPAEVAEWLGINGEEGLSTVAVEGRGVLETLVASTREMLARLFEGADEKIRRPIDLKELDRQVLRAFAPYLARLDGAQAESEDRCARIIPSHDDVLRDAIETSMFLGEMLVRETPRATRLTKEAAAVRELHSRLLACSSSASRTAAIESALEGAANALGCSTVSLIHLSKLDEVVLDGVLGAEQDPLCASVRGNELLRRLLASDEPTVLPDLPDAVGGEAPRGLWAAASAPVVADDACVLVAYAGKPDGRFSPEDLDLLRTVAGQLSLGLRAVRTPEPPVAGPQPADPVDEDALRERLLAELGDEIQAPLLTLLESAARLRDGSPRAKERARIAETITSSAEALETALAAARREKVGSS